MVGLKHHRKSLAAAAALLLLAVLGALHVLQRARDQESCLPFAAPGTEVWFALGQSNAGNHAEQRHTAGPEVTAFDGRRCSPAADPLPGADGDNGSLWTPLAALWVREGRAPRVLIAVVSQESTGIERWQPGGKLHRRALRTAAALQARGLSVTRILWLQGESDSIDGTGGDAYARALAATLEPLHRATGAPVYVAQTGRCGDAFSPAIRNAQARVAASLPWAHPGPDLDTIHPDGRFERCHFDRHGQRQAVILWRDALAANPDLTSTR